MLKEMNGGREGTAEIHELPEGCIVNVISFTTPSDACRLSLVSSTFRSAAESDVVWDRFLPPDYQTIISQCSDATLSCSTCFSSKKDLYLWLSDSDRTILIDGGKKSFFLDKRNGKKCFMLSARDLDIVWGDTPRYWKWSRDHDASFAEVAELMSVCWLEIKGHIDICLLSTDTLYSAYLVFKASSGAYGFEFQPVEVIIGLVGGEAQKKAVYLDAERGQGLLRRQIVPRRVGFFNLPRTGTGINSETSPSMEGIEAPKPKERKDGWLEIELGEFWNEWREAGKLEMGVFEVKGGNWKGGLVVQGIEIRPKETN